MTDEKEETNRKQAHNHADDWTLLILSASLLVLAVLTRIF